MASFLHCHIKHYTTIAYADDITIVMGANNWREVESRMAVAAAAIELWTAALKLEISAPKTVYIFLKGNLRRDRSPYTTTA